MILNYITKKVGLAYDEGGKLAKKGALNPTMLKALNSLEFYDLPFPKSIGYEWFVEKVVPIIDRTDDSLENLLHTSVVHISEKVAEEILQNTTKPKNSLLVTGGGALNHFLINMLQEKLGDTVNVIIPSKTIIEFKEALIFALMGVLRINKKINVLSSVTGAKNDTSSGVLYASS
jgi:anhydro-N-acetylmuramic acid kinase